MKVEVETSVLVAQSRSLLQILIIVDGANLEAKRKGRLEAGQEVEQGDQEVIEDQEVVVGEGQAAEGGLVVAGGDPIAEGDLIAGGDLEVEEEGDLTAGGGDQELGAGLEEDVRLLNEKMTMVTGFMWEI